MASSSTALDILKVVSQYSLYTAYIIFIGGVIGNVLNIVVFTHLKLFRGNRCAFYFIVESIVDIGYLIVLFTTTILTTIHGNDDPGAYSLVWCRMRSILFQIFTLLSFSITCLVACDQFCSTHHRFDIRQICTLKLARYLTFVAAWIWIVHSIGYGLFLVIQPSLGCVISNDIWTRYSSWFFYPVLSGLLPIIVSSSFSLLAFRNVHHIVRQQVPIVRRRLDRQMTKIVLSRVVVFVIFSLPYAVYRIYIINFLITRADLLQYAIRLLIQTIFNSFFSLNFAINFYLFVGSSSRYRRQVKYVLVKIYWRRWMRWFGVHQNQVDPVNTVSDASNAEST